MMVGSVTAESLKSISWLHSADSELVAVALGSIDSSCLNHEIRGQLTDVAPEPHEP
jgi:hypothetical protein